MDKGSESARQKILEIAQELFVERGYQAVSIREIGEACGLSKPGLYYYFTDKQELFLALLNSQLDSLGEMVAAIENQPGKCREKIGAFLKNVLCESAKQAALIRLGTHDMNNIDAEKRKEFSAHYQQKFLSPLAEILKDGMADGELREIDEFQGVWALLGLVYPFLNHRNAADRENADAADFIESVFFEGLSK